MTRVNAQVQVRVDNSRGSDFRSRLLGVRYGPFT